MKKYFFAALAAAFATATFAAILTVSWTNATQNTDNTAIPASGPGSIASTRIEYGSCAGTNVFGTKAGEVTVTGQGTTASLPNLGPGTYCARAFHTNTYGEESGPSNVASKTIAAPVPKPPSNFSLG